MKAQHYIPDGGGGMLAQLLEWWNFIFFLPLVLGLLLGLLLVFTGLGAALELGETGGDAGDAEGEQTSGGSRVLSFFGIGRGVPLMIMLPILLVVWGVSGLLLNRVLDFEATWWMLPPALSLSLLITAFVGQGLARTMSTLFDEPSGAVTNRQLVGQVGRAVHEITAEGGVAHVRDMHGHVHRLVCRVDPGHAPIPARTPVQVVRFLPEERTYHVEPYERGVQA
jgi:membrane protein implicated in regulation of membrane protease activity